MHMESNSTKAKQLSEIDTLMEEMQKVILKETKYEYWDESSE